MEFSILRAVSLSDYTSRLEEYEVYMSSGRETNTIKL